MTASKLQAKIIAERVAWIRRMLSGIRSLPLTTYEVFASDPRNVAAAESHLRRALEALLDLGRHVLAKGFGHPAVEYRAIASGLVNFGVLSGELGGLCRRLAGYRNRLVHFYHEISDGELYDICAHQLSDVETVLAAILLWIETHPEKIDHAL